MKIIRWTLLAAAAAAAAASAGPAPGQTGRAYYRPDLPVSPANQPLVVKVLVLNYDPLVPSEDSRRLSQVFRWNQPEKLAAEYRAALEDASGGAVRFEMVEWRNLNEIYAQADGHRYTVEEYVRNRRQGSGWHEGGGADYPRLLQEQGVPARVDRGEIDEVWIFSDHFFGLWEASMAGPGAFFINGGVYPQVPTKRPFAFYGFNYERGVAEMLHNTCHRTEATMNRFYGQWNLAAPKSNWDLFSANDRQSGGRAGVGTCHWPANAEKDYDYANPRTVQSWADAFYTYPDLKLTPKPVSAATWDVTGRPHVDYMKWYFGHFPRAAGVNPDGRRNNWWKYLYDFQNYAADGSALPPRAWLVGPARAELGAKSLTLQVAYSSAVPVKVSTLGHRDLRVRGPGGRRASARLVGVSDRADGTYRVATYRVNAPGGAWDASELGDWQVSLRAGEVRDAQKQAFPALSLGAAQVLDASTAAPAARTD